jgi:hypothetical protein
MPSGTPIGDSRVPLVANASAWMVLMLASCGGRVGVEPSASSEMSDSATIETAESCPATAPVPGVACPSPGLECEYPRFFCWTGRAICSSALSWERPWPSQGECPAQLSAGLLCEGEGSCTYTVDLGCGPTSVEALCECLDASWLWQIREPPELCDCATITQRSLCMLYPNDCTWSERASCEPRAE